MLSDPFSAEDGDVILRAGPDPDLKHDFRVHKLVLSLGSPVFKVLFQTAQPDDGQEGLIPAVPITDPPESVDLLLRSIYPGVAPPTITDLPMLLGLLTIVDKYAVPTACLSLKERLAAADLLEKDPFGVFIVARRLGLIDEAKVAARGLTLAKVMNSPSSKNAQNLAGEDLFRLMWFIQKRGDEGKRMIQKFFMWGTDPTIGAIPCGDEAHSGEGAKEFFAKLAEQIVEEFEVNPCLDLEQMVRIFTIGPDPPSEGFCGDIASHPAQRDFYVFCPTQPSRIVAALAHLTSELERNRDVLLGKALGREFPT